jgi:hypothetical protein
MGKYLVDNLDRGEWVLTVPDQQNCALESRLEESEDKEGRGK